MKRWKTKAMAAKRRRNRREISLSSEEERNYESNTKKDTDPEQADDKYPLQYLVNGRRDLV